MSHEALQSATLSRWLGVAASARGRGHVSKEQPCQDASAAVLSEGLSVVITSDGAGSARLSDQGAEIAVRLTADLLSRSKPWDDLEALKSSILNGCRTALEMRAGQIGAPAAELAATLSFVAIGGAWCVVGNLGDGLVAGFRNGSPSVLTALAKGEFANETVFLTSRGARARMELTRYPSDAFEAFAIMTDGAAESLYQRRSNTVAPAVGRMLHWLDENSPDVVEKALVDSALPMLLARTRDDCSVGLLRRVSLQREQLATRSREFQQRFLGIGNALGLRNRMAVLEHHLRGASMDEVIEATGLSTRTVRRHREALSTYLPEV